VERRRARPPRHVGIKPEARVVSDQCGGHGTKELYTAQMDTTRW
jgi:hypothetical protein